MSNLKFVVLWSVLLKIAFCICVTIAAIHFNDPALLWWYLLAFAFGYTYSDGGVKTDEKS